MSSSLTTRDYAVARLLAEGHTNRQIARTLTKSERTAEWYVAKLRAKLGLATRTQVAVWAVQHGINPDSASSPAGLAGGK
jgi:DNA-binding NarL/FixJ family response regulator